MSRHLRSKSSLASIASAISELDEPLVSKFKKLDIYSRPKEEFRRSSVHGAVASLVAAVVVSILFWRELQYSMRTETVDILHVNSTFAPRLNISFDLVFPSIPCALVSVDVEDTTGSPQEGVVHHVMKRGLDKKGNWLGQNERQELGDTVKTQEQLVAEAEAKRAAQAQRGAEGGAATLCGDCYGAGLPDECCNTCAEVEAAFNRDGRSFDRQEVAQCVKEDAAAGGARAARLLTTSTGVASGGCNLVGYLEVSKSEGNFHIAPGQRAHSERAQAGSFSLLDMLQIAFEAFNSSHTIRTLAFGEKIPGVRYPLDGQSRSVEDTHGMYQYFIKVVPTTYRHLNGTLVTSNQYSVTEHLKHVSPGYGRGVPGVYFHYEISPIQALVEERRRGFLQFLTSVCAIIGGVYTVLGLVCSVIEYYKPANKKS